MRRVALLRGINVGKAKRLSMADLRTVVEGLGHRDVVTLLNSGNVVFTSSARSAAGDGGRIETAIANELGVTTRVTVLDGAEVTNAVESNPLGSVAADPSKLLLLVLRDANALRTLKPLLAERWSPEAIALEGRIAYLWCAKGILGGRLWPAVERLVRDGGTARNLATMTKLAGLLR